jgi:hypothetical protein
MARRGAYKLASSRQEIGNGLIVIVAIALRYKVSIASHCPLSIYLAVSEHWCWTTTWFLILYYLAMEQGHPRFAGFLFGIEVRQLRGDGRFLCASGHRW